MKQFTQQSFPRITHPSFPRKWESRNPRFAASLDSRLRGNDQLSNDVAVALSSSRWGICRGGNVFEDRISREKSGCCRLNCWA